MCSDTHQLAFFSMATQYYVMGRYGVLSRQIPVAGNLLHRAIEMYLKGALSKTLTLKQLKKFSHRLPVVWAAFKATFSSASLARFDTLVSSLNAFEELRYPDSLIDKGMAVTAGMTRVVGTGRLVAADTPEYDLYLDEIDAFVGEIFQVASVNPAFFLARLSTIAREHLKQGNAQPWSSNEPSTNENGRPT